MFSSASIFIPLPHFPSIFLVLDFQVRFPLFNFSRLFRAFYNVVF